MALELDELQELSNNARKLAQMAYVMWTAIDEFDFPHESKQAMLHAWWNTLITPKLEFPDFSNLFKSSSDE
jgi:DUF1365 family protein